MSFSFALIGVLAMLYAIFVLGYVNGRAQNTDWITVFWSVMSVVVQNVAIYMVFYLNNIEYSIIGRIAAATVTSVLSAAVFFLANRIGKGNWLED